MFLYEAETLSTTCLGDTNDQTSNIHTLTHYTKGTDFVHT